MAKYQFEVEEEITKCYDCPFGCVSDYECNISNKEIGDPHNLFNKPDWCPLKKVEVWE